MYFARKIQAWLLQALQQFPVCLMTGPRQAGKSTLLKNALQGYRYVTLDDPLIKALANDDPELFLSRYSPPLIIDEIQYAPGLLPYLKIRVDANREKSGQYILTGSQTFQVMEGVSESLAGRIAIFHLYPFNWEEVKQVPHHQKTDDEACASQIIQGFYPEFFVKLKLDKNLWYSSYLATYIERDVRNIKAIADLGRFQTFIGLLAARAGKLLNHAEIAKECGISQPTVKDWIAILESTYIIYLLKPYHNNLTKRLVKTSKIYFVDTGLLCYLLGIDTAERFFKSSERGAVFENMVVMECVKQLSTQKERSQCFFYRTASGLEVDLIVEKQGRIDAFEIKLAKSLSKEMARPLSLFCHENPVRRAAVISLQEESLPLLKGIEAMHWSCLKM